MADIQSRCRHHVTKARQANISGHTATRLKCPISRVATSGDISTMTPATNEANWSPVTLRARSHMLQPLSATDAISSTFCAVTTDNGESSVAPAHASAAVCVWSTRGAPTGANRNGVLKNVAEDDP